MTDKLEKLSEILASIQKNLKSPKGLRNKFGNFDYRNAEGILHAFKDEIKGSIYPNSIRIIINCNVELLGNRTFLKSTAILKVGDEREEACAYAELDLTKKGMDQAQLTGAATSYAKKYALCNLLAIDDSKDDPDANSGSKDSDRKKMGRLAEEDMAETLDQKNLDDFTGLKAIIESCGSLEELSEVRKNKENIKIVNSLNKYSPKLYEMIKQTISQVESELK